MTLMRRDPAQVVAAQNWELHRIKAEVVARINAQARATREKFVTTGKDMIYLAKEREALSFLTTPTDDLTHYPMLAAEVGVTAPTAWELAQVWANLSAYWRGVAAQIEGNLMRTFALIEAAPDVETVGSIAVDFHPLRLPSPKGASRSLTTG